MTPSTKREFMELKKQELMQTFQDPKERNSLCVMCRAPNTKKVLFPCCRKIHSFACEGCIPKVLADVWGACRFPGCEKDKFLEGEFGKTFEQHRREWIEKNGTIIELIEDSDTIVQPLAIDLLTPTMPEHRAEPFLLKRETTVTIENIALSDILLSKLLEKTKLVVGENVSVFGNFKGEDCIRAGMDFEGLCLLRPPSSPGIQDSIRFMENIVKMPNKSIKIRKVKKLELSGYSINVLPKLVFHEENEMEEFLLSAEKEEYVSEVMRAADNSIKVGKVKRLELSGYSVNTLSKLKLHGENEMKELVLNAEKEEHVSVILCVADNSIWLGKVKSPELGGYSANILPKLILHEENEIEVFCLTTLEIEHVSDVMRAKNNTIWVGKVKKLELSGYSASVLPKLVLHEENEMDEFLLSAEKEEYISEVIRAADNSIKLGKMKNLELWSYAINVLPKLVLHEEGVMERLYLSAEKKEHVSEIIRPENNEIIFGKVKKLELKLFAINVLPKLRLHKENVMEELVLNTEQKEHVSEVICTENSKIWLGRVKKLELQKHAINVLPKLKLHEENEMERFHLCAEKKEYVSETIHTDNKTIRLGKVKRLELSGYSVNVLPKLKLHEENKMEEFVLNVEKEEYASEVILAKNNTIWLGKIKKLELGLFAINTLSKLVLHEENKMEEFVLNVEKKEYVSEVMLAKNNTIWLGKIKKLELGLFAINTLSKLVLHEENKMEKFLLSAEKKEYVSEVMLAENNTIWLGKIKKLELGLFAINTLSKLVLHEENEMEEFVLCAEKKEYVSEVMNAENNSIKLGRVKRLELSLFAINILPKLALHEENEMEEFVLKADREEYVSEVILAENNTIWLGKVKKLELSLFAINTLSKLVLHKENEMEKFLLSAEKKEYVSEVILAENNIIKLRKVKKLELSLFAINTLSKLVLHEENEMEGFVLSAEKEEYVSETIRAKNNTIWLGKIKKLELSLFAINILPKLALHEENKMEKFVLKADREGYVSETMLAKNNSIKLGKVKSLELKSFAVNILPKLSLHKDNVMEKFHLSAEKTEHVSEVIRAEN
ncbi:MAG: uncharacterized protein A8A55_2703, partial [Amphiamblys sp. WSBS2006]